MALTSTAGTGPAQRLGWSLAVVILGADQLTKWAILELVMSPPRVIEITEFFNLVLTYNQGASFSLLAGLGAAMPWVLALLALSITGFLAVWLHRTRHRVLGSGLGLVIGGALGNVVDRGLHGGVVDFIDLHAAGFHWPAFNLADSAIVVGVGLIILDQLRHRHEADET